MAEKKKVVVHGYVKNQRGKELDICDLLHDCREDLRKIKKEVEIIRLP